MHIFNICIYIHTKHSPPPAGYHDVSLKRAVLCFIQWSSHLSQLGNSTLPLRIRQWSTVRSWKLSRASTKTDKNGFLQRLLDVLGNPAINQNLFQPSQHTNMVISHPLNRTVPWYTMLRSCTVWSSTSLEKWEENEVVRDLLTMRKQQFFSCILCVHYHSYPGHSLILSFI